MKRPRGAALARSRTYWYMQARDQVSKPSTRLPGRRSRAGRRKPTSRQGIGSRASPSRIGCVLFAIYDAIRCSAIPGQRQVTQEGFTSHGRAQDDFQQAIGRSCSFYVNVNAADIHPSRNLDTTDGRKNSNCVIWRTRGPHRTRITRAPVSSVWYLNREQ